MSAQQLVDKLLIENLKALQPYQSARRLFKSDDLAEQPGWLNANESPFANEYNLNCERLNRYPDCQPASVINAYASYAGVNKDQVICSRGADEGIELLIRAFCTPGQDKILICPPTYGMYAISAETFNVGVEKAPLKADFSLDISAINSFKDKVKLVFICSPNNPTGTDVAGQQLTQVLDTFAGNALVVVDEAYFEFSQQASWAGKLAQYPNLVVLRTLSKAFALAGIRCGFTLADNAVIQALLKVIAPYPVPDPVAQIAKQALSSAGISQMQQQVSVLNDEKTALSIELGKISQIELVGDTAANFILFRTPAKQALMDYLVKNGLIIRDQSRQLALDNCLRISIGNPSQNQRLIELIQQFFTPEQTAS
ncbi:histidinol-phosphate transaminase [Neptunicella marina]|uniref:Histidinol-phosphate aminotransferase n=1 Tax=Neptunicella marina TaxID=2125989 RepID=A0A8J6IRU3_9ALTE|nr:histidinol-phosphate transaminase [Neptunicella marina]MBC3764687.1 histidinol-phosphate transaminase [Neptunicella marina]